MSSSRLTVWSSLPIDIANPALVVASAWKPDEASRRAEPTSHGLGITNSCSAWCSALKRARRSLTDMLTPFRVRERLLDRTSDAVAPPKRRLGPNTPVDGLPEAIKAALFWRRALVQLARDRSECKREQCTTVRTAGLAPVAEELANPAEADAGLQPLDVPRFSGRAGSTPLASSTVRKAASTCQSTSGGQS